MEQHYAICRVAVAPLRTAPSDKAEISSQLLFGDHAEILEETAPWWRVRNAFDGYEGWLDLKQMTRISQEQYVAHHDCRHLAPASPVNTLSDAKGSLYYLSPGSSLPFYHDGHCSAGEEQFEVLFEPEHLERENLQDAEERTTALVRNALFFLNVPYLWGGRNCYGMDCSGFTQVVFKLSGISLKRDAWQQAEQGVTVDFLQEARPGDMAFFDNEAGRITHVGIMLSASALIHASGKVRIDRIDNQGIYNEELGRYTHQLRIIKRFL